MRLSTFALSFTVLGAIGVVGCSSNDSSTSTVPPASTPSQMGGGGVAPAVPSMNGAAPTLAAGGKGGAGAGGSRTTSFDGAPESMKKLWGGDGGGMASMMGGGTDGATAGAKPAPIRGGIVAMAPRKDPFESLFKQIVQITPAWNYAISHRTAPPYVPKVEPQGKDPELDLPPLPPIPRRIAGVFYNGGISAIIESGNPPDSTIAIVQPGAEVDSGVPGVGQLVVESISMESLILRANDGRSVEVKLSGLSPSVRDALRQQFAPTNTGGTGGGAGFPGGMGGGAGRPGGMGGGVGRPGGKGGGGGGGGGGA